MFVSPAQVCVVYVVKELRHSGGLGQLMEVARKRERAFELQTSRKNVNYCIQHRNSIKMMQESLKSKYNKLLSFRHEEVII